MKRAFPLLPLLVFSSLAGCDGAADVNGSLAVSAVEPISCAWSMGSVAFECGTAVTVAIEDPGDARYLVVAVDTDSLGAPIATTIELPATAAGEHRVEVAAFSSQCVPGLALAHAVSARLETSPGDPLAETARWNLEVEVTCN